MPKPINDEFSDLPISRQRKYQLRHRRDGLCYLCGQKQTIGAYCAAHAAYPKRPYISQKGTAPRKHREVDQESRLAKIAARKMVNAALMKGQIIRQECQVEGCGKLGQAHHEDYSKPLDITWLCYKHHLERHGWIARQEKPIRVINNKEYHNIKSHESYIRNRKVKKTYNSKKYKIVDSRRVIDYHNSITPHEPIRDQSDTASTSHRLGHRHQFPQPGDRVR